MSNKYILILLFLMLSSLSINSQADRVYWKDAPGAEFLPPFCGTSKNPKYVGIDWKARFGRDLTWINHYCKGKVTESSCFIKTGREKTKCLQFLTKEYRYSIIHASNPNYKLFPFLYTELGVVRSKINDYPGAIENFNIAIKKNPKYTKAYLYLAKLHIQLKNYSDASAVVNKGLSNKKSRSLLKLKKQLLTLSK